MDITVVRDGLKLAAKYEYVADPIVIMSHGFMGDMGYKEDSNFVVLEKILNENGYSTIRYDFNGHGKSDGKQEDMTVHNEISDLMTILKYVKEKGHTELFLLGHSQGGVVSSMVAGYYRDQIKALVLMAPAIALKYDALKGECMGITYDPQHIPESIDLHGMYKLGGNYIRIAQQLPIYEVAASYTGPVCLIHGTEDIVVNYKYSVKLNEEIENCEFHLVEGENHNIKIHRDECFNYVLDFLNKNK